MLYTEVLQTEMDLVSKETVSKKMMLTEILPSKMTSTEEKLITEKETEKTYKWDIVWLNVFIIGGLHLAALYGFYYRVQSPLKPYLFSKFLGIISSFGITGGAHRLWCHRSYKANWAAQVLLMCCASITYQNSVYNWCRDHRMHHKYSDTDADPHNSKRGLFFSHVGWLLVKKQKEVKEMGKNIDMSDLEANPLVMFQHKYYYYIVIFMCFIMPTTVTMYLWNVDFVTAFFGLTIYRYVAAINITWSINSFAHVCGMKPYDKNIVGTENLFTAYGGLGEGFHNYHHTFPWDYKAAELGNDFRNLTTILIDCMAKIGWVTDRKTVDPGHIEKRSSRTGDGSFKKDKRTFFDIIKDGVFTSVVLLNPIT